MLDFELPGLEVLQAEGLPIDDETLASIGKRCGRLSRLNLEGCLNVTTSVNCKELKEMNLRWCNNVSVVVDFVALVENYTAMCFTSYCKSEDFVLAPWMFGLSRLHDETVMTRIAGHMN
ncbi:hypothetical protein V6N12_071524 [Hibiscus sabdariffa]|uniref:Uncharacterized protein n=1 Tax=Hibiscus sabdariffa TaxID=183260 RepID=A0ABR2FK22_9ROSI